MRLCLSILLAFSQMLLLLSADAKVRWRADWIWDQGEPYPYHYFLMARRTFELVELPTQAVVHITAGDRYKLYLNGNYVGRGPSRGEPRLQPYDTFDVASKLKAGRNAIAVLVYHYGTSTGTTRPARGGLLVQLDYTDGSGRAQSLITDSTWRVRPAKAWLRNVLPINNAAGVTEIYNANLDPADWISPDFDDVSWDHAAVLLRSAIPWSSLEPRQIPFLRESEFFPKAVITVGEVVDTYRPPATDIPEILARETPLPLEKAAIKNPDGLLRNDGTFSEFEMAPRGFQQNMRMGLRAPYALIDFGKQLNGFPRLKLEGPAGAVVDLTYGQFLENGRIQPIIGGVRYGDRYILRSGAQSFELNEYKQFRYLQITVRNTTAPVKIDAISVNLYEYPAPIRGNFECSDEFLNKLWQACTRTTLLSMDDGYMDTSWREKRNWLGDGSHVLLGVYPALGDIALTDRYFRLAALGDIGDGLLRMFYPGSDIPMAPGLQEPLNIPHHSLVWAVRVGEHYRLFGKKDLMTEMYGTLVRLVRWWERHANEDGLVDDIPYWNWLDWSNADLRGANLATNLLYMRLLQDLAEMAGEQDFTHEVKRFQDRALRVRNGLRRLLWNEERGLFEDSFYKGSRTGIASELGNGLALAYGLAEGPQVSRIAESLLKPQSRLAPVTPLFVYYVLEGLIVAGRADLALDLLRTRFGPMLKESDTIWENWNLYTGLEPVTISGERLNVTGQTTPTWELNKYHANSLVHCAGVTPAMVLSSRILGIDAAEPGFRRARIEPRPVGLQWAKGIFPSVRGDIGVEWQSGKREFSMKLSLPQDVPADVTLPDSERIISIQLDGRPVPESRIRASLALTGGSHRIMATYRSLQGG